MESGRSFTIRQKITLAFIFVILLLGGNAFLSISINRNSNRIGTRLEEIYYPLIENLKNLNANQKKAVEISRNWVYNQYQDDKQNLKNLILKQYPKIRVDFGEMATLVQENDLKINIKSLLERYDELVLTETEIMDLLTTKADFENQDKINLGKDLIDKRIYPVLSANNEKYDEILRNLNQIISDLNSSKKKMAERYDLITYVITGVIIIIIISLIVLLPGLILKRINKIKEFISVLSNGNLPDKLDITFNDEIAELEIELNILNKKMNSVKNFAIEIGKGNFTTNENVFDNSGQIGTALDEMRASLIEIAKKQEEQRKEEEVRNWMTAGFARFNEILRVKNDNINDLAYDLVKELVKYTNAIIGGVYIVQKDTKDQEKLIMSGLFAYERKRYIDTEIEPGEGLIGTCYIEKHKIYMRNIPDDYLKISSGLGEAPPRELLIVPLINNDNIYGVIEIATLNNFSDHIIEFIEKGSEALASTISSVTANMETAHLLKESQEQAEQLKSQEEELRQNMEEIQAAQDEMHRKQSDLEGALKEAKEKEKNIAQSEKEIEITETRLQLVIDNLPIAVYWKDANLVYKGCNMFFAKKVKKESPKELIGRTDYEIQPNKEIADAYRKEDEEIMTNKTGIKDVVVKKKGSDGKPAWSKVSKLPLLDINKNVIGIIGLIEDISEKMSVEEKNN